MYDVETSIDIDDIILAVFLFFRDLTKFYRVVLAQSLNTKNVVFEKSYTRSYFTDNIEKNQSLMPAHNYDSSINVTTGEEGGGGLTRKILRG